MPLDLSRDLCRHFAMGCALGALMVTALFAAEAGIFRMIAKGASPEMTATVVAACVAIYCGIGAALSGFLLIVTDDREA